MGDPFAEPWVSTVRRECLDHLLIVSRHHFERVLAIYVCHHNQHQASSWARSRPTEPCSPPDVTTQLTLKRLQCHDLLRKTHPRVRARRSVMIDFWHLTGRLEALVRRENTEG
jgi:hypothetical protein